MGTLFAISIVAFIALLWASFSIAHHVRRARRRAAMEAGDTMSADLALPVHEVSFSELAPYGPALVSRTVVEPASRTVTEPVSRTMVGPASHAVLAPAPPPPLPEPATPLPPRPSLSSLSSPDALPKTSIEPGPTPEPALFADPTPASAAVAAVPAEEKLPAEEDDPAEDRATPVQNDLEPSLAAAALADASMHPLAAPPSLPDRLDWAYFNKDMGDLSDPLPSPSRLRPRTR